jgi:retinol dehydrogenase-12
MGGTSGDLTGRRYLVTGGNSGIGRAVAMALAERGAQLHLACRSLERGRAAAADITARTGNEAVQVLPLDLADLGSVRDCAQAVLEADLPLHGLVNNAGLAGQRGVTRQGFELSFGVNYLGHFLLTQLLRERLEASAPARVVIVTSKFLEHAVDIPFDRLRTGEARYSGLAPYGVSKLATALFNQELARRWTGTGVTSYAVHPGLVGSHIWQGISTPLRPLLKVVLKSPEQGAVTPLYCLTAAEIATDSGHYYEGCRSLPLPGPPRADDLGARLWERSQEWVAPFQAPLSMPITPAPQPEKLPSGGREGVDGDGVARRPVRMAS